MNREDVLVYQQRWQRVHEREIDELRSVSPERKLQQVSALMSSVDAMGWRKSLEADDFRVWGIWQKLRQRLAAR